MIHALLDDQSDTTFIMEKTINQLDVNGMKTQLLLSTMYSLNEMIESLKIKRLVVHDFNHRVNIHLPEVFSNEFRDQSWYRSGHTLNKLQRN